MRELVEKRVSELRTEYQAGQQMLAELAAKQTDLQQTLLRISGAIQVLEELLSRGVDSPGDGLTESEGVLPGTTGQTRGAAAGNEQHDPV